MHVQGVLKTITVPGLFMVAAANNHRVEHCFLVERTQDGICLAHDGEVTESFNSQTYEWIENVFFIRKVELRD